MTAKTLKPMYFSNSFSNCFSWQNFFSSIINCWQADRINTPDLKKPSNDPIPTPLLPLAREGRPWAWAGRGGWEREEKELEGNPLGRGPLLTSSAWARSWGSSACLRSVAFFLVIALRAAHLQLEIQAAHEIMNSLRADWKLQARYQRTHTHGSVTH